MRLPAAALLLALYTCSGGPAPATILVNLAPDAAADAPDDAQPPVDAAAPIDAQDAATTQDAADADAWVECYGDPIISWDAPSSACLASGPAACPPCAPYPFTCTDDPKSVPQLMPLDGVRLVSSDGGRQWCAAKPWCARNTGDDDACKAAYGSAFNTIHGYSCSEGMAEPPRCQGLVVIGRKVECCE